MTEIKIKINDGNVYILDKLEWKQEEDANGLSDRLTGNLISVDGIPDYAKRVEITITRNGSTFSRKWHNFCTDRRGRYTYDFIARCEMPSVEDQARFKKIMDDIR